MKRKKDIYYTPIHELGGVLLEGSPDVAIMKRIAEEMEGPELGNPPFELKGGNK